MGLDPWSSIGRSTALKRVVAVRAVGASVGGVGVIVTAGRMVLSAAVKTVVKSSAAKPPVVMIEFSQMVRLELRPKKVKMSVTRFSKFEKITNTEQTVVKLYSNWNKWCSRKKIRG